MTDRVEKPHSAKLSTRSIASSRRSGNGVHPDEDDRVVNGTSAAAFGPTFARPDDHQACPPVRPS
jgi:hypothetical protein